MKRLALMLAQCLLLAGCTGLPRPREMGEMALLRTIGVDAAQQGVSLTVSTGQRAKGVEGEKQSALVLSGEGVSLSAAALELRQRSDSYVFFGYVDKLLLGEDANNWMDVLGWFAHDNELGLGAKVWLLAGVTARQAVEAGGEDGVERRLSALELDGKLGSAPMTRTAGEIYSGLLDRGCTFVPLLSGAEELNPAGYAILRWDELVGRLEGDAARGLELLAEKPMAEVLEVSIPENRVSLRLTGAQLDCKPFFAEGTLQMVKLTSRVSVELAQWEREPNAQEREAIRTAVEKQLEDKIRLALMRMQQWQAECIGIGSRVAIAAPWHWDGLEKRWQEVFSGLDYTLNVKVTLGQ